jgi:hypothetical protein
MFSLIIVCSVMPKLYTMQSAISPDGTVASAEMATIHVALPSGFVPCGQHQLHSLLQLGTVRAAPRAL